MAKPLKRPVVDEFFEHLSLINSFWVAPPDHFKNAIWIQGHAIVPCAFGSQGCKVTQPQTEPGIQDLYQQGVRQLCVFVLNHHFEHVLVEQVAIFQVCKSVLKRHQLSCFFRVLMKNINLANIFLELRNSVDLLHFCN